jgi:Na+/H+-dicarboxylate symporter
MDHETRSSPTTTKSQQPQVYEGVFEKLITSNIFFSFNEANFAAVVFFAIIFGIALSRVLDNMGLSNNVNQSIVMQFLQEIDAVLLVLINWIIMATPCTLCSRLVVVIALSCCGLLSTRTKEFPTQISILCFSFSLFCV